MVVVKKEMLVKVSIVRFTRSIKASVTFFLKFVKGICEYDASKEAQSANPIHLLLHQFGGSPKPLMSYPPGNFTSTKGSVVESEGQISLYMSQNGNVVLIEITQ